MKGIILLFVILFVSIFAVKMYLDYTQGKPISFFSKNASMTLGDKTFSLTVAKTDQEKQIGLSKKTSLRETEGMVFLFDKPDYYAFWMKDMKFSIDIVFLQDKKIVTIVENVSPLNKNNGSLEIINPDQPADTVVELPSGSSKKYNLRIGDTLTIKL